MKKIIAVCVLALGFIFTIQAQKGKHHKLEQFTIEQQTTLAVKRMTLKLDLTNAQQNQIKPLLADNIAKRKVMHEKRKGMKEAGKKNAKLSANERFNKEVQILDAKIAFKAEMKRILDKKQYERFEKISDRKMHKKRKHHKNNKKEKHRE
ncbi:hypothetical protein PG913_10430 [Tenacibaculum pacificus]|uniref:hypothetical protein n=1 Tax=Tenacibaculum pacificus TaxID=3018314 RepID=UPI0022F3CC61|nr:hypothetical protein [Tenacibaculum pacificus]WBX73264.1 hypothetical protein PG913_10430 [Tenacibaculum pacificus]